MKSRTYEPRSERYGPVEFRNVEFGKARSITAIGDKRIILDGKLSLNLVESTKYGREIHIQVYSKEYEVEERNPSGWSRMEIYFPIKDLDRLIEALLRIKLRAEGVIA